MKMTVQELVNHMGQLSYKKERVVALIVRKLSEEHDPLISLMTIDRFNDAETEVLHEALTAEELLAGVFDLKVTWKEDL